MALKGTTKIELTNVKTGEKEVYEKTNLVTNAIAAALDSPFAYLIKSSYSTSTYAGNIIPICPNIAGGILLFEDKLIEDPNQYYAQPDNKIVGYSSNIVNNKTDIMRGSMNLNESGELETHDGYRFVFDFTTSQANGIISAVGLTSKWGGMAAYGSMNEYNTRSPKIYYASNTDALDDNKTADKVYALGGALHFDEDSGVATSVFVSGQNSVAVVRIPLHTKNWKLSRNMSPIDFAVMYEQSNIQTELFAGSSVTTKYRYYAMCDGGDGYVWGFEHAGSTAGNSTDKASINWIKIKLDDLTFEEGTWEIDAQIYRLGYRISNPMSYTVSSATTDYESIYAAVLDGYLYCFDYALTGVYKINLSNVTDVKFIKHPDGTIKTYTPSFGSSYPAYGIANMTVFGNRICMWNGWLNGDEIVPNVYSTSYGSNNYNYLEDGWRDTDTKGYPQSNFRGMYNMKSGVFVLKFDKSSKDTYFNMNLAAPYLATINNLASPVEKTADKTMKITYILREETT